MRAFLKAAAIAAAVMLSFVPLGGPAFAQASSVPSVATSAPAVTVTSSSQHEVVSVPADSSTTVTIPTGDWTTQVVDVVGAILMAAVAALVGIGIKFLPGWVQVFVTASVQAQLVEFVRQGIAYAIQKVDGFDANKEVNLNVGSEGVATALRYVIEHAPAFLVNLAGGKDSIVQKIIAYLAAHGIALDATTSPADIAASAQVATVKASS